MAIAVLTKNVFSRPTLISKEQFIEKFKESKKYDENKDYGLTIENSEPDDEILAQYWVIYETEKIQ